MFSTLAAFVPIFIYILGSIRRQTRQTMGNANGVAEMGYGSEWNGPGRYSHLSGPGLSTNALQPARYDKYDDEGLFICSPGQAIIGITKRNIKSKIPLKKMVGIKKLEISIKYFNNILNICEWIYVLL